MKRILTTLLLTSLCLSIGTELTLNAQTPVKKTVAEFLAMSNADTTRSELSGEVIRIRNYDRGNLYLKDDTGTVLIYGISDAEGKSIKQLDLRKGDFLTVQGRRFVYDGRVIEMKNARYLSHTEGPDHTNVKMYEEPDQEPKFRGKQDRKAFSEWVAAHLNYPGEAKAAHIDGTVMVQFTIGTNGKVQEVQVVKGVHPALNAEAIRVVSSSPKWKPAMIDNHPVRATYTIPVVFTAEF